jgi:outer membrane protein OmpA-like peptidoglycan-associated protein
MFCSSTFFLSARQRTSIGETLLKSKIAIFRGCRHGVALAVLPLLIVSGCAGQGGMENVIKTDTGKSALLGGGGGAAIGAIVDSANPWAGALIGAAGGALTGGLVGHFMDQRKQDLERALQPQINAGQANVSILADHSLLISMTERSAFKPGSEVVNTAFIPTLRKVANVVSTYGKMTVSVIGHPDATGSPQQRARLANARAEAVRSQLIGMGVPTALISASGNPNSAYMDGRVELVLHPLRSS